MVGGTFIGPRGTQHRVARMNGYRIGTPCTGGITLAVLAAGPYRYRRTCQTCFPGHPATTPVATEDPRVDLLAGWMVNDRREGTVAGYRDRARTRLTILNRAAAEADLIPGTVQAESRER